MEVLWMVKWFTFKNFGTDYVKIKNIPLIDINSKEIPYKNKMVLW